MPAASLSERLKRIILGPGQLISFAAIVLIVVFLVGDWLELSWDERWTLGSLIGLVVACFVYYTAIDQKGYAFFFGLSMGLISATIQWTLHNPIVHLLEGVVIAIVLVRADLGRVPSTPQEHRADRFFHKLLRVKPPSRSEQEADPAAEKSLRILHYVDYPQLIGLAMTALFYVLASRWFGEETAGNFIAGSFAFQLVSGSICLTFIQWDIDSAHPV